jgi:hypothetical protein
MNTSTSGLKIAVAVAMVLAAASFAPSVGAAAPPETPPSAAGDSMHHDPSGTGCPAMSGMKGLDSHAMMGTDCQAMMGTDCQAMKGSDGKTMGHAGHGMMGMRSSSMAGAMPALPGQDAFGAIQEIVAVLDADPKTDWSKVDLEALRQHLIDMNEVTLRADAKARPIDDGIEIAVTGSGRTLAAIQRMIPAHAQAIDGSNGWSAKTESLPNGELLTVTAKDPKEVQHIRGLGFIGILVSGMHHQAHHLAIAEGAAPGAHQHRAMTAPASKP